MKKTILTIIFSLTACFYAAAQCETFAFADFNQGKVFIMEDNKLVWEHPAPQCNDLWVLPGGNLLFTTGNGVLEVTRDKDTVFYYSSESTIFACQRLSNGNTFVGECTGGRLLEVSPQGKIVKEVSIVPQGTKVAGSAFMRNARKLDNGNYLVSHYGPGKVTEYNDRGEAVWSVEAPGGPHSSFRLPNGNTMIAVADANKDPRLIEVDREGSIVWEISNRDVEGAPFKFLGGMHCIDGTIMVANWLGHGQQGKSSHVFLIDRNSKKIICEFKSHPDVVTVSSVFRFKDVEEGNYKVSAH